MFNLVYGRLPSLFAAPALGLVTPSGACLATAAFSCPLLPLLIPLWYCIALVSTALVQLLFCFVGRRFHGISLPRVAILLP